MPVRSRSRWPWPRLRTVLPPVVLLAAVAVGASGPYLRWGGDPTSRAAPASSPELTVDPGSGPAGSTVSLSLIGGYGSPGNVGMVTVAFDTPNAPLGQVQLVPCTVNATTGAALGYGFGVACNGQAQVETVPAGAQLGEHLFIARAGDTQARIPFQVTNPPTLTATATPTLTTTVTATQTVAATPTASATTMPSASVTPTGTAATGATATATTRRHRDRHANRALRDAYQHSHRLDGHLHRHRPHGHAHPDAHTARHRSTAA